MKAISYLHTNLISPSCVLFGKATEMNLAFLFVPCVVSLSSPQGRPSNSRCIFYKQSNGGSVEVSTDCISYNINFLNMRNPLGSSVAANPTQAHQIQEKLKEEFLLSLHLCWASSLEEHHLDQHMKQDQYEECPRGFQASVL